MALEDVVVNGASDGGNEIFGNDTSKVKTFAINLNGNTTDIVLCDYSDKLLIIITQYQKIGSLISVVRDTVRNVNGFGNVFDVKTISGLDSQEYELAARYLAEQVNIQKPAIFAISIKDKTLPILKTLAKVLVQNKNW